jgi:hypothetical protein
VHALSKDKATRKEKNGVKTEEENGFRAPSYAAVMFDGFVIIVLTMCKY